MMAGWSPLLSSFERIDGLSGKLDVNHAQVNQATSEFAERLSAVESAIAAEIETAAAKHQAYANDLSEVHEALMKLNQNQHTLAGSMDEWRTDFSVDVANILNRLTSIDRDNSLPVETLERSQHAHGHDEPPPDRALSSPQPFPVLAFGTDDWIGASWRSQKAAIEAERQRVKGGAPSSA